MSTPYWVKPDYATADLLTVPSPEERDAARKARARRRVVLPALQVVLWVAGFWLIASTGAFNRSTPVAIVITVVIIGSAALLGRWTAWMGWPRIRRGVLDIEREPGVRAAIRATIPTHELGVADPWRTARLAFGVGGHLVLRDDGFDFRPLERFRRRYGLRSLHFPNGSVTLEQTSAHLTIGRRKRPALMVVPTSSNPMSEQPHHGAFVVVPTRIRGARAAVTLLVERTNAAVQ